MQRDFFRGRRALLATMHGKERAVAPALEAALGCRVETARGLDTDTFGTFTREVARAGTQLDAARRKCLAALAMSPETDDLAIASEGAFGPHPAFPFVTLARELVLLLDRRSGVEVVGGDVTLETNAGHAVVATVEEGLAFARGLGFPGHGAVVVALDRERRPDPLRGVWKEAADDASLARALGEALARSGGAHVEADLRAHRNPTRMSSIARAAGDLARRALSLCPRCARPGFWHDQVVPGLACAACGEATDEPGGHRARCAACGHESVRAAPEGSRADPGRCPLCNP